MKEMATTKTAKCERGSVEWLAQWVIDDAKEERLRRGHFNEGGNYYMLRPNNPALAAQMRTWRSAHGCATVPMTDMERTLWELSLFSPDVIAGMMGYYARLEDGRDKILETLQSNAK